MFLGQRNHKIVQQYDETLQEGGGGRKSIDTYILSAINDFLDG